MIKLLNNKQVYLMILTTIIISVFFASVVKEDYVLLYFGNLSSIPIRYFLITISVVVEYFVYRIFTNSTIISRYNSKMNYLRKSIRMEILLSILLFGIFNLVILVYCFPISFKYLTDITITIINFILVYITISLIIKCIDLFINMHNTSCILFLSLFVCLDFIIEHFNFFFLNNSIFDLSMIYKICYTYPNGFKYLIYILISDLIIFYILSVCIKRKDFIIKNDEENE